MKGLVVTKFSLFLFPFLLISCSGVNGGLPNSDKTIPTVMMTLPETPPVGQTVPVSTQITVTFSEAMDEQSVINGIVVEPSNAGTIN